ncbi:hypothetical protein CBR_g19035 [Chara braunii]|uniref:Uncharacterized protein n=1 Tax=Chara braunii TaxID=69332 RepID=A0A388KX84_CHABU|nr:hypothetical protein CBR_g19035 [Chara braunii]|eukprot:GBG74628.1 hypothetical protein CBR_g19035 [Chara braunii]
MAASWTSFSGSEAYYKSNLDLVLKENKQLKLKVDQLERENRDLRKSVYDLSIRLCACLEQVGKSVKPFNIDSIATMADNAIRGEVDPAILSELMINRADSQGRDKAKAHHQTDGRHMYLKFDLKGHAGPVYSGQFSKATNLLASGSFDQTVRVWNTQTQREELCFAEHQLIVSDVCWSDDGAVLLSGGYDHCVKEWDVVAGKGIHSYGVGQGFVLAVRFNPADNGVFLAVGTSKLINVFDRRDSSSSSASSLVMENDSKVNALHIYRNGLMCLTGDSRGAIKVWDFRKGACCLETLYNEDGHKPISWMEASHPVVEDGEEEGRYLAVNSFDNVLRVYDQSSVLGQGKPLLQQGMKMLHAIKGTRNKNWTIKSSLFRGQDCELQTALAFIYQSEVLVLRDGEVIVHFC